MDKMLEKLMEQEARLVKEQQSQLPEGEIKFSPKIDIEECLRNGCITADDYRRTHELVPLVENLLKNNFSQRDIEIFLVVECSDDMKIGEVAEKYNVSVERVRQIIQNVRKMLRMGEDPHWSNYA